MDPFDKKLISLLEEELDLEQITVSEDLIAKTLERAKNANEYKHFSDFDKVYHSPKKGNFIKKISAVAAVFLLLFLSIDLFMNHNSGKFSSNDNMEMEQTATPKEEVKSSSSGSSSQKDSGDIYDQSIIQENMNEESIMEDLENGISDNPAEFASGIASMEITLHENIENEEVTYIAILELIEGKLNTNQLANNDTEGSIEQKSNRLADYDTNKYSYLWKLKIVYFTATGERTILIDDKNCYILNELEEIVTSYSAEDTSKLQQEILNMVQ